VRVYNGPMQNTENGHVGCGGRLFGRVKELQSLEGLFEGPLVHVTFLTGIPGAGTSTLLHTFADNSERESGKVFYLDCQAIQPTQDEFLTALDKVGFQKGAEERQILCLDHYDHFRLLDAWLRENFAETLGQDAGLVLAIHNLPPSLGVEETSVRARCMWTS
ncbi:MAG: hypothetical protein KDB61_15280, partial [Planctomycetes bacterium]|nr:hypothetical protein [Planctomycetota bacterium]